MQFENVRYADAGNTIVHADVDGRFTAFAVSGNRFADALAVSGLPIAAYVPPVPTADDYAAAIEAHLDWVAKSRGYASAERLASYVNSTVAAWAGEASAFVAWRDAVWLHAYAVLAAVQAGQQAPPTIEALVAGLPAEQWA